MRFLIQESSPFQVWAVASDGKRSFKILNAQCSRLLIHYFKNTAVWSWGETCLQIRQQNGTKLWVKISKQAIVAYLKVIPQYSHRERGKSTRTSVRKAGFEPGTSWTTPTWSHFENRKQISDSQLRVLCTKYANWTHDGDVTPHVSFPKTTEIISKKFSLGGYTKICQANLILLSIGPI
jgi:hypothetical protein